MWVLVDRFSHWVTLIPARTGDTAQETAQRLFDGHWAWFGVPKKVITDQDPLFTASFSTALDALCQVDHHFTPARRHDGNGLVERQIRTLKEYITVFANRDASNWSTLLKAAQFAFNSSLNAATGIPPLKILLGQEPRGPWSQQWSQGNVDSRAEDFFRSKHQIMLRAEEAILKRQVDQVVASNLTAVEKEDIAEGDWVFLDRETLPDDREMLLRKDKLRHK